MLWPLIVISYLSLFSLGLADNLRGPVFPQIIDYFQVNNTLGSLFFGLSSAFGLIGSLSPQILLRYFDRVGCLRISLFLLSISLFVIGSAVSFYFLLVGSAIFGFSLGLMGVFQNSLVSLGSPPEKRQQMLSGLHAMYGLASMLAPLLVATIYQRTNEWRSSFYIAALIPICSLVYSYFIKYPQLQPIQVQEKQKMRWPEIWLATAFSSYVFAEIMVSTRLALVMQKVHLWSPANASIFVTGFFVMMLIGRLGFTFIRFQWDLRVQLMISLGTSIIGILLGTFIHPYFFFFVGLTMAPFYPMGVAYLSETFPQRIDQAISTMMVIQGMFVVMMHLSIGKLTDLIGLEKAILLGPLFLFFSLLLLYFFSHDHESTN